MNGSKSQSPGWSRDRLTPNAWLASLHNHRNMALRSYCRHLAAQVFRLKLCVNDCPRNAAGCSLSLAGVKSLHEPTVVLARSSRCVKRWHRRSWHRCASLQMPSQKSYSDTTDFSRWTLAWGAVGEFGLRLFVYQKKHLVTAFDTS